MADVQAAAAAPPSASALAAAAAAADPPELPADGKQPAFALGRVYSVSSSILAAEFISKLAIGSYSRDTVEFQRGELIDK